METNKAVQMVNITKTFGSLVANDKVCLDIHKGEILSLLGENGSGKTTLMNMLSGIYLPDSPEALEFGAYRMTIICATYYICGIMDAANGGLRGIGASMLSMLTSLFGSCVFRVVWIFTVFEMLRTPFSLYISYPISWTLTGGVQILLFILILNRKFRNDPLLSPEAEKARA